MLRSVLTGFSRCRTSAHQKIIRHSCREPVAQAAVRLCSCPVSRNFICHRKVLFPVFSSQVRWISKKDYQFPEFKESEIEEDFVRGSGPGGQSVNQTGNCVVLKHIPSGIVVKCHETRSLEKNRIRARERLQEHLDNLYNGENSFKSLKQKEEYRKEAQRARKSRQRLELKKAFKHREGLD